MVEGCSLSKFDFGVYHDNIGGEYHLSMDVYWQHEVSDRHDRYSVDDQPFDDTKLKATDCLGVIVATTNLNRFNGFVFNLRGRKSLHLSLMS